jgi:NADPH-dependent curcumin reductase CurA
MIPTINRQVRLKLRPNGIPQSDHFEIVAAALPEIADKQFMVRNEYLSVEPAMRGWVAATANYSTPVGIGVFSRRSVPKPGTGRAGM